MKLNDLVLNIDQAKHLQELGLNMDDAALCFCKIDKHGPYFINVFNSSFEYVDIIPAYTLQEIIAKLPKEIEADYDKKYLHVDYNYGFMSYKNSFDDDFWSKVPDDNLAIDLDDGQLLTAAYTLLCWVIENGYYKLN